MTGRIRCVFVVCSWLVLSCNAFAQSEPGPQPGLLPPHRAIPLGPPTESIAFESRVDTTGYLQPIDASANVQSAVFEEPSDGVRFQVERASFFDFTVPPQVHVQEPTEFADSSDDDVAFEERASGDSLLSDGEFYERDFRSGVGQDFYSSDPFSGGLIILGDGVAMKIGGYVKADLIYDFDAIDSTDTFNVDTIPPNAEPRRNSRFHARQTRLNLDTRWETRGRPTRLFVEGDFFGEQSTFRLRHAFGEVGPFLAGQTWTTFTDTAAAPATLDMEGSVSSVNRRQAQIRWTTHLLTEDLTFSASLENPQGIVDNPLNIQGQSRQTTPDAIARVRYELDWGRFQLAAVTRRLGYQVKDHPLVVETAMGANFTGVVLLNDANKFYYQVVGGNGIGSYRSLPDAAPLSLQSGTLLNFFGWMVGYTHDWNDELSSNYTFAKNTLQNTSFQGPNAIAGTTYSAINLIWQPTDQIATGIEYLYGIRKNNDRSLDDASRIQVSFIYYLP